MPEDQPSQPSVEQYVAELYKQNQALAQRQEQLAQQNAQIAQLLQSQTQRPSQPPPPALTDIDATNKRLLDEFVNNPIRVVAEIKNAAVAEAEQRIGSRVQADQQRRDQERQLQDYERAVMAQNPDLVGWEGQIANYLGQTDPSLSYDQRVRIALDATRAFKGQVQRDALTAAQQDQTMRARQGVPSGGQGTQAGPADDGGQMDEMTMRQQMVANMNQWKKDRMRVPKRAS